MKYFSTFSGIGGFELGIQLAYENNNRPNIRNRIKNLSKSSTNIKKRKVGFTCVGFSEIDKHAIKIYKKHFNHKEYGDITRIKAEELPDFDILVGGFPCQTFSIAGKRRGFEDTRGTMFFELARILRAKQPRLFVFENVKGLLSHDNGNTFRTIIAAVTELGYDCQWQVLNSKNHGVPQNRERVFIIGHLRGTSRPEVFPFGSYSEKDSKCSIYTGTLTSRYPASQREGTYLEENGNRKRTLRKLTPTECERLQGFPDSWTEGVSDTQRYKALGNAVTVNVIEDIFIRLLK